MYTACRPALLYLALWVATPQGAPDSMLDLYHPQPSPPEASHGRRFPLTATFLVPSHGSRFPLTADPKTLSRQNIKHPLTADCLTAEYECSIVFAKTKPKGLSRQKSENPEGGALGVGEGGTTRSGDTLGGRGALAHSVGRRCRGRDAHGDPVWGIGFHGGVQHPGVQH